jgi:hypothetical protein
VRFFLVILIGFQLKYMSYYQTKRLGIAILFCYLLFLGITIHFHNRIVIPQIKRGLIFFTRLYG